MLRCEIPYQYEYQLKHKENPQGSPYLQTEYIYTFKSKRTPHLTFLILVDQFAHHTYVIKFCLKSLRQCELKYNLMTQRNEVRSIIFTCISVLNSIYQTDHLASFGFIGAPTKLRKKLTIEEKKQPIYKGKKYKIETLESENNTKRYRVYRTIVDTFIDPTLFKIQRNEAHSMYLLMNTAHEQKSPDLLEKICGMIDECYLSENMLTPERISVN